MYEYGTEFDNPKKLLKWNAGNAIKATVNTKAAGNKREFLRSFVKYSRKNKAN